MKKVQNCLFDVEEFKAQPVHGCEDSLSPDARHELNYGIAKKYLCNSSLSYANGEKYRPSNSTDGMAFETVWCDRCSKEDVEKSSFCELHDNVLTGEGENLWQYQSNTPVCPKFERASA